MKTALFASLQKEVEFKTKVSQRAVIKKQDFGPVSTFIRCVK